MINKTFFFCLLGMLWSSQKVWAQLGMFSNVPVQGSSVLNSGTWFKLPTVSRGIHKIDYNLLRSLGYTPEQINPNHIHIFGNGGYVLAQPNATSRIQDLRQNSIWVRAGNDASFNTGDEILFYATGTVNEVPNLVTRTFSRVRNIYSDTAYYFLTINANLAPKQVETRTISGSPSTVLSQYNYYALAEKEIVNRIGSGREWYGEFMGLGQTLNFDFTVPGIKPDVAATVNIAAFANLQLDRTITTESTRFQVEINTVNQPPIVIGALRKIDYGTEGVNAIRSYTIQPGSGGEIIVNLTYDRNGFTEAQGFLNFIEVNASRDIGVFNGETFFRCLNSLGQPLVGYQVANASSATQIWDVTNFTDVKACNLNQLNGVYQFIAPGNDTLRSFLAFNPNVARVITTAKRVVNQNLHSINVPDMLIVTPSVFYDQALAWAQYRERKSGLEVDVATTEQIYNEFSSGAQDLSAIRDFARYLYYKTPEKFKYLFLFGDGSFDYKNRIPNNTNFVPIFESNESLNPINSYSSDDYFCFMDLNEGRWTETDYDRMDIGVGRITAKTREEVASIFEKVQTYESAQSLGPWRNRLNFVADNGDNCTHLSDANVVADNVQKANPDISVGKLYLGSFPLVNTASGRVSPAARTAVNEAVNKGSLVLNFSGHGNEQSWTSERILNLESMVTWRNKNRLTIMAALTCDFGRYDDPARPSGAEFALTLPNAGAVACIAAARPVFNTYNRDLNDKFMFELYRKENGLPRRLGDIFRVTKNNSIVIGGAGAGNRNFAFLGDPSMVPAVPVQDIVLSSINNRVYTDLTGDTLSGLELVNLVGEVRNPDKTVNNNFNGTIYTTVADKVNSIAFTDNTSTCRYSVRNNFIYNGTARVTNGRFNFSFVVPADISYVYGLGSIVFYASHDSAMLDANGSANNITIGGLIPNAPSDTKPPVVNAFINDYTFKNGDYVSSTPRLIGRLSDESGINLSTSGIGHEITAELHKETPEVYILNENYEAAPNDFTTGTVNWLFSELLPGTYSVTLKAWDTHNNSGESTIQFKIADPNEIKISDAYIFPNPSVSGGDAFLAIRHSAAGRDVEIEATLTDILGRSLYSKEFKVTNTLAQIGGDQSLNMPLRDSGGQALERGNYFVKIRMKETGKEYTEKVIRLVIGG